MHRARGRGVFYAYIFPGGGITGILYERIYDFENLYQSACMAARQKRYKNSVLRFFNEGMEERLITLQNELIWKSYALGAFNTFEVHDPKRRTISSLPFRDRVVQIALCNIVEPIFERRFIYDSYACRVGKGSIAAANRLSYFIGKPDATKYLKCDIQKFFYSVDVDILERIIKERFIQDEDVLWLIDTILRHEYTGLGIKIGNRFSQLAANVILNEVDFHFKVRRQTPYYIRYMDDIIILGNSKAKLHNTLREMESFLKGRLHLELNNKTRIDSVRNGIDFVGYRIFPKNKIIKKGSMNRTQKVFKAWKDGKMANEKYLASIGSRCGHATGTASYLFYNKILLQSLQVALSSQMGWGGGGGKP